jgi:hypothetical protein
LKNIFVLRVLFWLSIILSFLGFVQAAEDLTAWSYSTELYFDTSPNGADISSNLVNFPVLVRLREPDFSFAQALDSGKDLRFTKPDGTILSFEIDRWDSVNKLADIWIKIDTLKGNSNGTLARIYWGNPLAAFPIQPVSTQGVFDSTNGFLGVWHMGGRDPGPRQNAVAGFPSLIPANYNNDENCQGAIGFADSLASSTTGEHLQVWNDFSTLNRGFTFSVWANPSVTSASARFIDFGSGPYMDNIILKRTGNSKDLAFEVFNGAKKSQFSAIGAIELNEWQLFTVTVSGKIAKIYKNGALVADSLLNDTLSTTPRTANYVGRSHWSSDGYYKGKLDEITIANTERSADWIKLSYANQKADQIFLTFVKPPSSCIANFYVPADTTLPEGSSIILKGIADCASSVQWTIVSGPAPRILDPDVKALQVFIPRITRDTVVAYRFTANYGSSFQSKDVIIKILEKIPDPVFTLPNGLIWNGKDTLLLEPKVTNLDLLLKSTAPDLRFIWSFKGMEPDTLIVPSGLKLVSINELGILDIDLCIDNGGVPVCNNIKITIGIPTRLSIRSPIERGRIFSPWYDLVGRRYSIESNAHLLHTAEQSQISRRK